MPHVGSLTLINADGKLINFSRFWPLPTIDVTDRDFFQALKSNSQLTYYLGSRAPTARRDRGPSILCAECLGRTASFSASSRRNGNGLF